MAIITFWNNNTGKIGQSYSALAITTYIGIEHNYKTLLVSTKHNDDVVEKAFQVEKVTKDMKKIIGFDNQSMELETGIEGLAKMSMANRLTSDMIPNYTKVILKNRLETLISVKRKENIAYNKLYSLYPNILSIANKYYDMIFVDLNNGLNDVTTNEILNISDVVIFNIEQKNYEIKNIKNIMSSAKILSPKKTLVLINNYDRKSKYSAKNISREVDGKINILTVPYSDLFSDAIQESTLAEFALGLRTKKFDSFEDRTSFFTKEVKRASEAIIYKMQELQMII